MVLTNYMKEIIAYRQWNLFEETHLIDHLKENYCYLSLDFLNDLRKLKFNFYLFVIFNFYLFNFYVFLFILFYFYFIDCFYVIKFFKFKFFINFY